jgi:hypothetical protein
MDAESDGALSRAPELEDVVALCRALDAEAARYLLIGGFAVILHGFVRTTKDIDLLIDTSDANVSAVKRALASLPDNAAADIRDADVRQYTVVRVADEIVVDLMGAACGVTYGDAMQADTEVRQIDGVAIPVAGPRLLIRLKDTYRPSDHMDVAFLRRRLALEDEGS